jgi:hypothetical protein
LAQAGIWRWNTWQIRMVGGKKLKAHKYQSTI